MFLLDFLTTRASPETFFRSTKVYKREKRRKTRFLDTVDGILGGSTLGDPAGQKNQMRKRFSVHDHGWGTYTFFLNLKTCFLNRSRAVDIPRYQNFCSTPNSRREISNIKFGKNMYFPQNRTSEICFFNPQSSLGSFHCLIISIMHDGSPFT